MFRLKIGTLSLSHSAVHSLIYNSYSRRWRYGSHTGYKIKRRADEREKMRSKPNCANEKNGSRRSSRPWDYRVIHPFVNKYTQTIYVRFCKRKKQFSPISKLTDDRFNEQQSMVWCVFFSFTFSAVAMERFILCIFILLLLLLWSFLAGIGVKASDDDVVSIDQFSRDMIIWMRALRTTIDSILCIYCTLERNGHKKKHQRHKAKISRHKWAIEHEKKTRSGGCVCVCCFFFLFFHTLQLPRSRLYLVCSSANAGCATVATVKSENVLLILLFCVRWREAFNTNLSLSLFRPVDIPLIEHNGGRRQMPCNLNAGFWHRVTWVSDAESFNRYFVRSSILLQHIDRISIVKCEFSCMPFAG